jgi:signal transduction histidine kinase
MKTNPPTPRSIRRQVLSFALLSCACVLVPVGGGLFTYHYQQTQARLSDSLAATARITAGNVAAALAFNDPATATELLHSLSHDPLITCAKIEDPKLALFASYLSPLAPAATTCEEFCAATKPYKTIIPIVHDGVTYGQLTVAADIRGELRHAALTWGSVCAAAFLLAGTAVFFIARRFQRQIAQPITELASTALRVAHERDFDTRAPVTGSSEVIELSIAINLMFTEIARRDARLARQVDELNREIEERERAEETLRQNQQAMNRLAREAGMAEVASGVIHNIGNTLTSISISSDLVATRLANTRRRSLATLGQLLSPSSVQTESIFSAHADGPELRTLLAQITAALATDLTETTRLVEILQAGNSHLKRIVASQQSLARTHRLCEPFVLREALQEALLLAQTIAREPCAIAQCPSNAECGKNGDCIRKGPPNTIKDCALNGSSVYADRNLVVQILVNLLLNAHDAIASLAPPTPLICLNIGPAQNGLLPITVTDNGEGIPEDKLLSLFTYGYTTKAGGNGFGLHNSANAARMMGGELFVSSPGTGLGATFTLRLPVHSND